ncbi:MAG: DedA family protein [Bifidobacterium longum]|nr:DedA family protein [Bifidobacterium longum]
MSGYFELLKDPRAAIAGWIAMGVAPTLGFIFLIVFIETGVVFFPFLPGDSLLFAAGVFAAPDAATGKAALPLFWLLPVVFIRTFMPFISGISGMRWSRFTPFSVLGGLCWSTLFTLLGYFFGNIPAVQDHFELVIVLILLVSLAPTIIGLFKAKFGKKKPAKVTDAQLDVMEDGIKNLDK